MLGLESNMVDHLKGPLTAFQWRLLNEKDLRLLVHDVNNAAERQVTEGTLDRLFDATWQELKDSIDEAIDGAATAQATSKRKTDDMLVEVVETVRRIERYRDGDMKRAIEKELRLSEFSYTLGPQGERPFVVTTAHQ